MEFNRIVIDGCAFSEGEFKGISKKVIESPLDTFFFTVPGQMEGFYNCVVEIGKLYNFSDNKDNKIKIAKTLEDIIKFKKTGEKALIITFQDPHPIENSLEKLRVLYELGLRVVQLTYNKSNYIGTGCAETIDRGLTDFGREIVKKMNEIGIIIDLSHCSKQTALDVLKISEKSVIFSHTGIKSLTPSPRNRTDEELILLKKNDGVIGLSSWGPLCWGKVKKARPTLDEYVDHIDYVVDMIGIDHVGFGCDNTLDDSKDLSGTAEQSLLYPGIVAEYDKFVGTNPEVRHAEGIDGVWEISNVVNKLKERGYTTEDINKFLGGNFLRIIKNVWK